MKLIEVDMLNCSPRRGAELLSVLLCKLHSSFRAIKGGNGTLRKLKSQSNSNAARARPHIQNLEIFSSLILSPRQRFIYEMFGLRARDQDTWSNFELTA